MSEKKYSINNMLLAFIAVLIVIGLVALAGFFLLSPPDEIIMGQAEATQVRISGKVPGRIESYRFGEGDKVRAGDTLVFLVTRSPRIMPFSRSYSQGPHPGAAVCLCQHCRLEPPADIDGGTPSQNPGGGYPEPRSGPGGAPPHATHRDVFEPVR